MGDRSDKLSNNLEFELQLRKKNNSSEPYLDPSKILKWCTTLPMAQTGPIAKEMYNALNNITQTEFTAEDLLIIIEAIRPSVQWTYQNLKKHFVNNGADLDNKQSAIANLGMDLQKYMIANYKSIIDKLVQQEQTEADSKKNLILVMYRALYYSRSLLLHSYQLYTEISPIFWKELNLLYIYSDKFKILEQCPDEANIGTIFNIYKEILILGTTDPYRFTQQSQKNITAAMPKWLSLISLTTNLTEQTGKNHQTSAIFYFANNSPPMPLRSKETIKSSIYIDLSKLINHTQEILKTKNNQNNQNNPEYNISSVTYKQLQNRWQGYAERQDKRLDSTGKLDLAYGTTSSHYHINNQSFFNLDLLNKSISKSSKQNEMSDEDLLQSLKDKSDKDQTENKTKNNPILYACRTINISSSGLALKIIPKINNKITPALESSQLVAIKKTEPNNNNYSLGIIKWIKKLKTDETQIGIVHLNYSIIPAAIQPLNTTTGIGKFQLCFVLSKINSIEDHLAILTPSLPFKENHSARVVFDPESTQKDKIIKLGKEITATKKIKIFNFKITKKEQEPKINPGTHDGKNSANKFDDLWDIL